MALKSHDFSPGRASDPARSQAGHKHKLPRVRSAGVVRIFSVHTSSGARSASHSVVPVVVFSLTLEILAIGLRFPAAVLRSDPVR